MGDTTDKMTFTRIGPTIEITINGRYVGVLTCAGDRQADAFEDFVHLLIASPANWTCDGSTYCSSAEHIHGCFADNPCTHQDDSPSPVEGGQ
jgi:hypothetical protein